MARLDTFVSEDAARATGGEVYQVLESRRQLFTLRQRVLSTFAADWLLTHHDQEGRYMVLGFYGDEEGASRLCREHPEIKQFAGAHPASDYTAVDLTGPLCWRIEGLSPVASTV